MVGRPQLLCNVATIFHTVEGTGGPMAEPTVTKTVLTKVRICQGSGSRSVDALGDKNARKAILYFFCGQSMTNGNEILPEIETGDKVVEGSTDSLLPKAWTVSGVIPSQGATSLHHLEVSLV